MTSALNSRKGTCARRCVRRVAMWVSARRSPVYLDGALLTSWRNTRLNELSSRQLKMRNEVKTKMGSAKRSASHLVIEDRFSRLRRSLDHIPAGRTTPHHQRHNK